jgi:hypothetical protein
MLRLLRLRSRRVVFIEVEALGKRMSLSRRGWDVVMFSRGAELLVVLVWRVA